MLWRTHLFVHVAVKDTSADIYNVISLMKSQK